MYFEIYKGKLFVETKGRITLCGWYIIVLLLKQKVVSRYSAGCKHLISSWSPKDLRAFQGSYTVQTKPKNRWSFCHGKLSKCLRSLKQIVRAWKTVVGRLQFLWEGLFFGGYVGYLGMYSRQDMLDMHFWSLLWNRYSNCSAYCFIAPEHTPILSRSGNMSTSIIISLTSLHPPQPSNNHKMKV